MVIRRTHMHKRHVERQLATGEQAGYVRQKDRHEVRAPVVDGFARIAAYEQRSVAEVALHRRRDVRRWAVRVHMHDLDVCQLGRALGECREQDLGCGRGAMYEDTLARADVLHGVARTDRLRIFRTARTHTSDTSLSRFPG